MPFFVQIDGVLVTGILETTVAPDPKTYPPNRRFVRLDGKTAVPEHLSTIEFDQDDGEKLLDFDPTTMRFMPPAPPPVIPDPVITRLDALAAEIAKIPKA